MKRFLSTPQFLFNLNSLIFLPHGSVVFALRPPWPRKAPWAALRWAAFRRGFVDLWLPSRRSRSVLPQRLDGENQQWKKPYVLMDDLGGYIPTIFRKPPRWCNFPKFLCWFSPRKDGGKWSKFDGGYFSKGLKLNHQPVQIVNQYTWISKNLCVKCVCVCVSKFHPSKNPSKRQKCLHS